MCTTEERMTLHKYIIVEEPYSSSNSRKLLWQGTMPPFLLALSLIHTELIKKNKECSETTKYTE